MKSNEPIYLAATIKDGKIELTVIDPYQVKEKKPEVKFADQMFGSPVLPMFPGFVDRHWQITTRHLQSMRHVRGYESEKHIGVDINKGGNNADLGLPVYSCADGQVMYAGKGPGNWGNLVVIQHRDESCFRYAHLKAITVRVGDQVQRATLIGSIGNSSGRFEAHLHMDATANAFMANYPTAWPGVQQRNIDQYTDPIAYIDRRAWWR